MTQSAVLHCQACGKPAGDGDHGDCPRLLTTDPPRFCAACGFRLDVQVYPDGYRSSCRRCARASGTPASA